MCTVSYVPLKNGFILTSNRDENIKRKLAFSPKYQLINNKKILFPKDKEKGGTWIATDGYTFSVCLFNGAHVKHDKKPPYRESRGIIVLRFFSFSTIIEFVTCYDFEGIEPFSLVMVKHLPRQLWLLIWDGKHISLEKCNEKQSHLWASVTLYEPNIRQRKLTTFMQKLKNKKADQKQLVYIHKNTSIGDKKNDFVMQRNDGNQTVSISSISAKQGKTYFYYEDLLENTSVFTNFGC